jgi:hypothetical protein
MRCHWVPKVIKNFQVILLFVCIWGATAQRAQTECESEAVASAAEHQIGQMKLGSGNLVCLSLPNYKDPKPEYLRKMNTRELHLLPGSSCWKSPRGFLLIIEKCSKPSHELMQIQMEVDDMNLNGAHVASRLRKVIYKLKLGDGQWKVDSYQIVTDYTEKANGAN